MINFPNSEDLPISNQLRFIALTFELIMHIVCVFVCAPKLVCMLICAPKLVCALTCALVGAKSKKKEKN